MRLNDLPREIVSRCFSYLSTDLLTDIILLENIPDIILEVAADNLNNLWYFKRFRRYEINKIEVLKPTMKLISTGLYAYTKTLKKSYSNVLFGSIISGKTFLKCTKVLMKSSQFTMAKNWASMATS